MDRTVAIACPVYKREWVLPYWLKAIEKQNFPLSNVGFLFELGPDDDETHEILFNWQEKHPEVICFDAQLQSAVSHEAHPEGLRYWSPMRYISMVEMRNNLLNRACNLMDRFDYYFSLDSDVLLKDPETLNKLIDYSDKFPGSVISPLSFMSPDTEDFPSMMTWNAEAGMRASRRPELYPMGTAFEVDIVMAAVFMPKSIYARVRYIGHRQGEDLGFAYNLWKHGFKSIAATDIHCPHIMHRYMIDSHVKNWLDLDD